jgi:hypothetical protein
MVKLAAVNDVVGPAFLGPVAVPEWLWRIASDDDDMAFCEFSNNVVHQDTLIAVPWIVDLVRRAPRHRAEFGWLAGMVADPLHAYGKALPAVQAAAREHCPQLVALLDDDVPAVREAVAYAAAVAGVEPGPLWRRWRVEADPAVRASLALALGRVDPEAAAPELAREAAHGTVAATLALLRAGLPWPEGAVDALANAMDAGAEVPFGWCRRADWYTELVTAAPAEVATAVVARLLRAGEPTTRRAGIFAAAERCDRLRSAPPQLVPLVAGALHDPVEEVRETALHVLCGMGEIAGRYADTIAEEAARFPDGSRLAVRALQDLGDPRWVAPLCAAAARHDPLYGFHHRTVRFAPAVLDAVRDRVRADPARLDVLGRILAGWGRQAAPAVPDLVAALPVATDAAISTLEAIGHDDPAALPYLRSRAGTDLGAALAVHRLTGDAQPLLDVLRAALTEDHPREHRMAGAGRRFDGLDDVLRPLLPLAAGHLTGTAAATSAARATQLLAARVVLAADGPQRVVRTVWAVVAADRLVGDAADILLDVATTAPAALAGLEPQLRERFDGGTSPVTAARILARLGVPVAELAARLVQVLTWHWFAAAVDALVEVRAVQALPRLRALVDADPRRPPTVELGEKIWADECQLRRLRTAIAALEAL